MVQRSLIPSFFAASPRSRMGNDPLMMLRREMDRLFDDAFQGLGGQGFAGLQEVREGGLATAPRVDVSETEHELKVCAELPGVDQKNVEVMVTEDVLMIRGEKRLERDERKENFHIVERSHGAFQRALRLPFSADPDEVQASFENGVLTVTLPKPTEGRNRPRRIEVKSSGQAVRGGMNEGLRAVAEGMTSVNTEEQTAHEAGAEPRVAK